MRDGTTHSDGDWVNMPIGNTLNSLDFALPASRMENLKIQPLEQTLMQEGGDLEAGLPARNMEISEIQCVKQP
jgi:hypothetical protein